MTQNDRLEKIAQQLRRNEEVPPITVREFLSWFNVQRRGYWIVTSIRERLKEAGLSTKPDFEAAYIDSPIEFLLATRDEGLADQEIIVPTTTLSLSRSSPSISATGTSYADPTYRISKLAAANNRPISVVPDATTLEAVTIMLANDFSQLPVMTNERDVKGIISWTSIGTRLALGKHGESARELMDGHHEIRSDSSLFQAIPTIVQHQYVLVRGGDNRINGIVTATDLSQQFQQLTEPFLLLSEIENHIRRIIGDKFTIEELVSVRNPSDTERSVAGAADLTLGEYIRLLENNDRWKKLSLSIDRGTFLKQLDKVRKSRNDVMHFDPDGIPSEDLERLRDFTQFLQRLQAVGAS